MLMFLLVILLLITIDLFNYYLNEYRVLSLAIMINIENFLVILKEIVNLNTSQMTFCQNYHVGLSH